MKTSTFHHKMLPFRPSMFSLSLGFASLLLISIYFLVLMDIISTEAAIFAIVGVFAAAAVYESILFSLVTRHMMQTINNVAKKDINGKDNNHSIKYLAVRKKGGAH